jgi:hypothetical protein
MATTSAGQSVGNRVRGSVHVTGTICSVCPHLPGSGATFVPPPARLDKLHDESAVAERCTERYSLRVFAQDPQPQQRQELIKLLRPSSCEPGIPVHKDTLQLCHGRREQDP